MAASYLTKDQHILTQLCHQFRVEKLYAFGSVTTDQFQEATSDLDLLVAFDKTLAPEVQGSLCFDLLFALEDYFHCNIDLLINAPFRNIYFAQSVEQTKELLYAA